MCLRPDILENMSFCKTNQKTYLEAFRVESLLGRSHMRQFQPGERSQQRPRGQVVETLFALQDSLTHVIRQLISTNEKEEDWRQTKKFHTRVREEDKSVNLIIDNGSAINFVGQKVIEKLPKPYQVTWSNDFVILVTHGCLV